MSVHDGTNHISRSINAQRVAAWKVEVQAFFNQDWTRLRSTMMKLQETEWDDPTNAEIATPDVPSTGTQQNAIAPQRASATASSEVASREEPLLPRFQARDRLRELAQQIERKLQTTSQRES